MGTRQAQPPYTYDFAKVDDKVPMIEFLDSLNVRERAKVFASIEKFIELKNAGLNPKENLSKHLTDGIFEVRVSFENRIARTLFFYQADRKDHLFAWLCEKDEENAGIGNSAHNDHPHGRTRSMT